MYFGGMKTGRMLLWLISRYEGSDVMIRTIIKGYINGTPEKRKEISGIMLGALKSVAKDLFSIAKALVGMYLFGFVLVMIAVWALFHF